MMRHDPNGQEMMQAALDADEDARLAQQEAELAQQQSEVRRKREQLARFKSASNANPTMAPSSHANFRIPFSSASSASHDGQASLQPHSGTHLAHFGSHLAASQPMKRIKTFHPPQHPMPLSDTHMTRSKSTSAAALSACPFTPPSGSVSVKPMPTAQVPLSLDGQSANHQFLAPSARHPMGGQHLGPAMSPVIEDGNMMHNAMIEDPGMYLQRHGALDDVPKNYPIVPLFEPSFHMPTAHQSFPSHDLSPVQYGSFVSGPASSAASMTRTNSSVTGPFQMMRVGSDSSSVSDVLSSPGDGNFHGQLFPTSKKRGAPHDEQLLGVSPTSNSGAFASQQAMMGMSRSISMDSRLSVGHAQQPIHMSEAMSRQVSMQAPLMQKTRTSDSPSSMAAHGEPMLRTDSASSIKSTQSQRDRAKDSLQRQIAAAASNQLILPKPEVDKTNPDNDQSGSKSENDGKVPVSKSTYQRPKRPKIYCTKCDEQPDGFRGEHELRRHDDLKHAELKKVWVCVDPGADSELKPFVPIDTCKNCKEAKEYGVYYNAAAHLRRAHFTKKTPRASRKNGNGNDEVLERRGGRGGGNWPPMAELKQHWMKPVMVSADKVIDDEESSVSGKEGVQDPEPFEDSYNPVMEVPTRFDDTMAFGVGSNANLQVDLQVDSSDMFSDNFNDFPNYTVQPTQCDGLPAPASTGSASFNYPFTMAAPAGFAQSLPIDLNVFQGSHISTPSTASLTPYNSFAQDSQFTPGSSQRTAMTACQPTEQVAFGDFDFNLAMGSG